MISNDYLIKSCSEAFQQIDNRRYDDIHKTSTKA